MSRKARKLIPEGSPYSFEVRVLERGVAVYYTSSLDDAAETVAAWIKADATRKKTETQEGTGKHDS